MTIKGKWYLIQLKPNGFDRAVINLDRQGIKTFMPLGMRRIRSGKHYIQKMLPLFSNYLFIFFDPDIVSWRTVNSTYGVSKVVTFGQQTPQALPEQLILGLMTRCDEENCLLPPSNLEVGEQVKIISGPFADYIAIIEKIPSETRLGILFDCLGNKKSAQIDVENVERLSV
ncbi:MAG: transcription termination/antitermination protein NusG [Rhodomicrobiaceae bacterium]